MTPDPDLRELYTPAPPTDGDARKEIAYLRERLRPIALDDAVVAIMGELEDVPFIATLRLATEMVSHLHWPLAHGTAAFEAERAASKQEVGSMLTTLETRIRTLAYERAPGERMMSAAREITNRPPLFVPDDLLLALCRRVAASTVRTGHARRVG